MRICWWTPESESVLKRNLLFSSLKYIIIFLVYNIFWRTYYVFETTSSFLILSVIYLFWKSSYSPVYVFYLFFNIVYLFGNRLTKSIKLHFYCNLFIFSLAVGSLECQNWYTKMWNKFSKYVPFWRFDHIASFNVFSSV